MKFSVAFNLIEKAMTIVNANPIPKMLNDICPYVLIETNTDNTAIIITKSDLDLQLTTTVKAQIDEPGRTLVHGDHLENILKSYKAFKKADDCNAVISTKGTKLSLAFSDNKKYKPAVLGTRDPDVFVSISNFEHEIASCSVTANSLKDFFTKNLVAMNKNSSHETSAVYFKFVDNEIELISSNRQEAAIIKDTPLNVSYPAGSTKVFALIPRKTLETAVKIISGAEAITVAISIDMVRISGTTEDIEFSLHNEIYQTDAALDGDAMLPKSAKFEISIPTVALKNALAHMAAIMMKSEANKITIASDPSVPDTVTLSCRTPLGEIPGLPIPATLDKIPEPTELYLNDQRLISLLKAMRSQNIKISYTEAGSICSFRGEDEPYFTLIANSLEHNRPIPSIPQPSVIQEKLDVEEFQDLSSINSKDDFDDSFIENIDSLEV